MQSIRKRLSIILIVCSFAAVVLTAVFVNISIQNTFKKYMNNIQDKRNTRIVEYFQEVYKREKGWTKTSGEEIKHEAYMSNYCLTLLDINKNVIWGMNPEDIRNNAHIMMQGTGEKGVYTSDTFDIKADDKTVGYVVIGQYFPVILSEDDINFINSINKSIVLSGAFSILIIIIISLGISRQFSTPVKRVSDTSIELSRGNYESRSEIKSNIKEISNLIKSINILGDTLRSQDLLRKRLISDISHEIRTPLNVLQNNLEAMIDGVLPVTPDRLNGLNEEVIRFGKLLNNLDSLKKLDNDEMDLSMENIFLDEILSSVCDDFSISSSEKGIDVIFKKQNEGKFMTLGDTDKIKQVFINLISNAVKFTKPGGKVEVTINENRDKIVAKIKDNGVGIKKEDIPFIFERLYRGDKSRHEIEGSGIGLTIVRKILFLHSAEIEVESEPDKGTTFSVYFNRSDIKTAD